MPAEVRDHFGMLTFDDKQLYYSVARDLYTFSGSIVDLGAFCGATAAALVVGMQGNSRFSDRTRAMGTVYSYDLFKADYGACDHLNWLHGGAKTFKEGDDFSDVFRRLTEKHASFIRASQGDVAAAPYDGPSIEILSVDVCKSRRTTDAVFRKFMPLLCPGAYILHQDFIHPWHPYLHTAIGYFADRFEVIHENEDGGTVLHRLVKPIKASEMIGFSNVCMYQKDQWLRMMDRAFAQLKTRRAANSLYAARTLLIGEMEGATAAERYAGWLPENLPPRDRQWITEVLDYARKQWPR